MGCWWNLKDPQTIKEEMKWFWNSSKFWISGVWAVFINIMNLVSSFMGHSHGKITCGTNTQIKDDLPSFHFLFIQGPSHKAGEECSLLCPLTFSKRCLALSKNICPLQQMGVFYLYGSWVRLFLCIENQKAGWFQKRGMGGMWPYLHWARIAITLMQVHRSPPSFSLLQDTLGCTQCPITSRKSNHPIFCSQSE